MISAGIRIVGLCRKPYGGIAVAILFAFAAFWLTFLLPARYPAYYSFFLAAVAVCGILAGSRSAAVCTVLSAIISSLYFIPPKWSFTLSDPEQASRFLGFCGAALIICFMSALLDSSRVALSKERSKAQEAEATLARHSDETELLERSAKFWLFEMDLERDCVKWTDVYNGIRVARTQPFQSWLEQVHEEDRERVRTAVQEALVSGELECKFRFFVRMGEESARTVLARARVVLRDGKSVILRGINVDLSTTESDGPPSAAAGA
jgi:K+-sensing histidine kinase KdpD